MTLPTRITPVQEIKDYVIIKFGETSFNLFVNAIIKSHEMKQIPVTIVAEKNEKTST